MAISAYFSSQNRLRYLHEGPLGTYVDLYATQLQKEGHCQQSGWRCIRVVGDFSHWLMRKRWGLERVNERTMGQYERFRARYRCPFLSDRPALNRLLAVLREVGAIAPRIPAVLGPLQQIEQDFEQFLRVERGLTRTTIIRHLPVLRRFLQERCDRGSLRLSRLTAADIARFIQRHARDQSPRSAQCLCWTMRAFARYLLYRGHITTDLADSVPSIRRWRCASLPGHLSPRQIQQVLNGCDRRTAVGRRDYAILLLLARLGLRANEIATLTLYAVDWQSGQLTICGKGRRRAPMPLPASVGAAIADYLQQGRPRSDSRRLFLRDLTPHIGFASSAAVSMIAKTALMRAGIEVPRMGTHLFRHSLATQLLRAGVTLTEIGQVLRHKGHDTTRIYAKVDVTALRSIALRWPGGVL